MACSENSSSNNSDEFKQGLKANYSNGINTIEKIILHGWGSDCTETGNNFYQGACTPIDASPIDWAWGNNFTTTWTGFINIPEPGNYTFSAWVDGMVSISINDSLVANFNTVGSAYSKVLFFDEANWYPISMTFTANGGSNYMHLGWVKPGGNYETVPGQYLGYK